MPNNPVVFTPQPIIPTPVVIVEPQKFVDDEDLILADEQIKFKDRFADPNSSIKQGYKRVRQDDVLDTAYFEANTTYEFIYTHSLNDETIIFPEGVILEFNGGQLDEGTLVGANTTIDAPIKTIFGKKLAIDVNGIWNIDKAYSDWFDCYKNGYYIDPETFDAVNSTYEYEGSTFAAGTLCGATYNNDRFMLQQLLNLSAKHTIISEGIYMVDGMYTEGLALGEDISYQLFWYKKKGLTLQIDGILKMIPNDAPNFDILMVSECDNVKLCGSGKLVGDLPEHPKVWGIVTDANGHVHDENGNLVYGWINAGEGGMCLHLCGNTNFHLEGLTFEQAWGDGIFCAWVPYNSNNFLQKNHYWNNVKCLYNRRTGLGFERGDYFEITNSEFSHTGNFRGTPTQAGVDIEPYVGVKNAFQRFCQEIHFDNCVANYNAGAGFRFQRLIGGSLKNSEACYNRIAVQTFECYWGTVNKERLVVPHDDDDLDAQTIVSNRLVIDSNTFKYNYVSCFSSEESASSGRPSSAVIINNYIQECGIIISGGWQDTVVDNNNVFNVGTVFSLTDIVYNFKFTNNHVFGIFPPERNIDRDIFKMQETGYGSSTAVCRDVLVKNNTFKYSGGKKLHGGTNASKDEMTNGYPVIRDYMFQYLYYPPTTYPQNGIARFIDNHFDDELWAIQAGAPNRIAWGSSQLIWQERTISEADIAYGYIKHFLPGDKIHVNGQTGLVRVGGWIDVVGTELAANTSYQKNQFIYKTDRTAMFIAGEDFTTTSSPVYPLPTDTTIATSTGTTAITHLDFSRPIVEWQNTGTFPGSYGGNIYLEELNNASRRLIETATGNMYKWNGSTWVVV